LILGGHKGGKDCNLGQERETFAMKKKPVGPVQKRQRKRSKEDKGGGKQIGGLNAALG